MGEDGSVDSGNREELDATERVETAAHPLRGLTGFFAQPIPDRQNESSPKVIRDQLADSHPTVATHQLSEARQRYDDVFKRAENVERRAGTLQTSVVFAVTLTLTGGALLLDSTKVPSTTWRGILAGAMLVAVATFVWCGLHASLVGKTAYWKVVGKNSLQGEKFKTLGDAQRWRAASYIWCMYHNMAINQWKGDELDRALRWFLIGLAALVVIAALIAAYALSHAPVQR